MAFEQHRLANERNAVSSVWGGVIAFLLPALMFLEVDAGGRLFVPEIMLACMLPWLLATRGHLLAEDLPKRVLLLGLLWLLAQIITDQIRGTPFADWSRGWAKITFMMLDFASVYLFLAGRRWRYFLFALGVAVGQIVGYLFDPDIYARFLPWKFGYGSAVTLLVILFASMFPARLVAAVAMLIMGIVNFHMGFRSLGSVCLIGGWLLLIVQQASSFGVSSAVKIGVLSGLAILATINFYDFGASHDYFGEAERQKYLMQSSGEMGVLLGGRSEILASGQAVKDSPIIGHGSWAKDPKYAEIMEEDLAQLGYEVLGREDSDLIPTHSYLMGAWVEAGIMGAVFWVYVLLLTGRALFASYGSNSFLLPLILFEALKFLWDIPFSPFGAQARLYAAYDLSLMIFAIALRDMSKADGEV